MQESVGQLMKIPLMAARARLVLGAKPAPPLPSIQLSPLMAAGARLVVGSSLHTENIFAPLQQKPKTVPIHIEKP